MAIGLQEAPAISAEDGLFEVVNDIVVEKPMGAVSTYVMTLLSHYLSAFVRERRLGWVFAEMLHDLGKGRAQRRPDVSYVSFEKWPKTRGIPSGWPMPVVPELAVEVVSPSNSAIEVQTKIDEYFAAGVVEVWIIYPENHRVYVHRSATEVRSFGKGDVVQSNLFPGFLLSLDDLLHVGA